MGDRERKENEDDLRLRLQAALKRAERAERQRDEALKRGRLNRRVAVQSLVHSTALRRALGKTEEGEGVPDEVDESLIDALTEEPGLFPLAPPVSPDEELWQALADAARGLEPWKATARQLHRYGISSMAIHVAPLVALYDALDRLDGIEDDTTGEPEETREEP